MKDEEGSMNSMDEELNQEINHTIVFWTKVVLGLLVLVAASMSVMLLIT